LAIAGCSAHLNCERLLSPRGLASGPTTRLFGFFDAGKAWVVNPLPDSPSSYRLGSYGGGIRIKLFGTLSGDLLVAMPLRSTTDTKRNDARVTFEVKGNRNDCFANKRRLAVRTFLALLVAMLSLSASPASASWWNKEWSLRKEVTVDTTASGVNVERRNRAHGGARAAAQRQFHLHKTRSTTVRTCALSMATTKRRCRSTSKASTPRTASPRCGSRCPRSTAANKRSCGSILAMPMPKLARTRPELSIQTMSRCITSPRSGQPAADRTANANSAAVAVPGVDEGGIVGRAARFPGQGAIMVNPSPSLAIPAGAAFTVSAWIKPEQLSGNAAVFSRGGLVVGLNGGVPDASVGGATLQATAPVKQGDYREPACAGGRWHHGEALW